MTDPAMPPTQPLVYRTSTSGRVHAAYLGNCRVGYVEERENGRWMWQSIFLRPTGGAYFGKEDTEGGARMLLEMSVYHWIMEAGLQPVSISKRTTEQEETTDATTDQRPDIREDRVREEPADARRQTGRAGRGEHRPARPARKRAAKPQ